MGTIHDARQSLEHGGPISREKNPFLRTRTTLSRWRVFLAPLNISYHFEHHLNPLVPWYNLKQYSKEIQKVIPDELKSTFYNKNQVFNQLAGHLPGVQKSLLPLTQA